jgi:hypothetical protein
VKDELKIVHVVPLGGAPNQIRFRLAEHAHRRQSLIAPVHFPIDVIEAKENS